MKAYPSIPASTGQNFEEMANCYVFDKLDGSSLRAEYSKKQGWYKFGTRTRLFDETDPDFGRAIPFFRSTLAETIEKIASKNRWESLIIFTEFWGKNSFAGIHDPTDDINLTVFDANPYKKGILGPREFLKNFEGKVPIPGLIGIEKWTRGFVDRVRRDEIAGVTFEGVVGKSGEGHQLKMAKAKTQRWIDEVKKRYVGEDADRILNS